MTASELVAAAKMAAATAKAQQAAAAASVAAASLMTSKPASGPTYPLYSLPDLSEFSRIQMLIAAGKGGAGSDGKPQIVLGLWSFLKIKIKIKGPF